MTDWEEGSDQRGLMIEYGISDIVRVSSFFGALRDLGISVTHGRRGRNRLSEKERAAFTQWLREKRERERKECGL